MSRAAVSAVHGVDLVSIALEGHPEGLSLRGDHGCVDLLHLVPRSVGRAIIPVEVVFRSQAKLRVQQYLPQIAGLAEHGVHGVRITAQNIPASALGHQRRQKRQHDNAWCRQEMSCFF